MEMNYNSFGKFKHATVSIGDIVKADSVILSDCFGHPMDGVITKINESDQTISFDFGQTYWDVDEYSLIERAPEVPVKPEINQYQEDPAYYRDYANRLRLHHQQLFEYLDRFLKEDEPTVEKLVENLKLST